MYCSREELEEISYLLNDQFLADEQIQDKAGFKIYGQIISVK